MLSRSIRPVLVQIEIAMSYLGSVHVMALLRTESGHCCFPSGYVAARVLSHATLCLFFAGQQRNSELWCASQNAHKPLLPPYVYLHPYLAQ